MEEVIPRCVCGTRNGQLGCEKHKTGIFAEWKIEDVMPFDQYVHVRYRLAESTDSREFWHYESMPQSWLPEYMGALRAKGHDRFAFRILRPGEPWWPVP